MAMKCLNTFYFVHHKTNQLVILLNNSDYVKFVLNKYFLINLYKIYFNFIQ